MSFKMRKNLKNGGKSPHKTNQQIEMSVDDQLNQTKDDQLNSILEISQHQKEFQIPDSGGMPKMTDATQYSLMSHVQKSNSIGLPGPPSSAPFNPLDELDKDRLMQISEIRKRKK